MDQLAWLWVLLSLVVAGAISFTGFGLQAAVSATSATVVNHCNKVISFVLAFLIFRDKFGPWMVLGIAITMAGTVWYGRERLIERELQRKAAEAAGAPPLGKVDEETPLKDKSAPPHGRTGWWYSGVA